MPDLVNEKKAVTNTRGETSESNRARRKKGAHAETIKNERMNGKQSVEKKGWY